ncbi:MAG: tetratricopeptide repeat protein, partial [Candidatus Eisenbacteria sp.]|nr:tetratricopeptide repeat protein [Candidatus Eisenbacteria bacterium]
MKGFIISEFLGLEAGWWAVIIAAAGLLAYVIDLILRKRAESKRQQSLIERVRALELKAEPTPLVIQIGTLPSIPEDAEEIVTEADELLEAGASIDAAALIKIGNIAFPKSDYKKAEHYYRVALDQAEHSKRLDLVAAALGNMGLVYQVKGDLDVALKHHKEALKIHHAIGYRQGEAIDLGNMGLISKAKGNLDEARRCQKASLKIDREIGSRKGE